MSGGRGGQKFTEERERGIGKELGEGGQELGCRREVEQEEFRKWRRRKIGEIGKGKTWRFVEGVLGKVELGMVGNPEKRRMTGGRGRGYSGVVAVLDSCGGGARAAAALGRRRRLEKSSGISVAGARSGGGGTEACGGGGDGDGGWTPSPAFREQSLEMEETPFFFSQMTARVCGGVPSPLIEPIMGQEGKGPT